MRCACLILLAVLLTSACGIKGPLVLPPEPAPSAQKQPEAPKPQSEPAR